MVNQEFYNLGTAPSVIRQLFAYGLEQAAKVGPEKVYDYSLGNPSIPAPKKVNESIKKIVDETDSIKLHGYSMAPLPRICPTASVWMSRAASCSSPAAPLPRSSPSSRP